MKRRTFNTRISSLAVFIALASAGGCPAAGSKTPPSRSFEFTYIVHVPALPDGSHKMRIWIPLPQTAAHQQVGGLRLVSPAPYRIYREPQYDNRSAYFDFNPARVRTPFDIRLTFHAHRYEYKIALPSSDPAAPSRPFSSDIARYLRPNRLIPINGVIRQLSREQTAGVSDPLAKARKIYDYVVRTMHYDHAGTGWGRGDAIFACTAHHGNCTDFHSLFIGMARAAGIPARFEIGFPLPPDQRDGEIGSYHCWAEFYIERIGWIPIDASQAWLIPAKRNYFFGAVDSNRIRFTRGRDLVLNPAQAGEPLNYFAYAYAELDGKPFGGLRSQFSFRDLTRIPVGRGRY